MPARAFSLKGKEDRMRLPANKTKIVCTIGPASDSPDILQRMILAGMNIARLNFSHGDFEGHARVVENIRKAARAAGRRVSIMGDLPGPKIRIGQLAQEPIELNSGDAFTLTTEKIVGGIERVFVSFPPLTEVVKPGDRLFLNDGQIELEAERVQGLDVRCRVVVGGELRSRKGLNLPRIDLGISAFTPHDHNCLRFAAEQGLDAVSQSFVETAEDLRAVRRAAAEIDYNPFIIAKIERAGALDRIDEILDVADGLMVARGDLGVEIPIERIAAVQKRLTNKANQRCKPVITATQMLLSMVANRRPTRAEATDVANAILDGTDCVMLSEESAMGKYPVEAVAMLAGIAFSIEPLLPAWPLRDTLKSVSGHCELTPAELIALSVEATLERVTPAAVFVPTHGGNTARSIARFRFPVWVVAVSSMEATCRGLQFSYGVYPVREDDHPDDWKQYTRAWLDAHELEGSLTVVTEGPSSKHPEVNNRMEIIRLREEA